MKWMIPLLALATAAFAGWVACAWFELEHRPQVTLAAFPQYELYRELAPCRVGPRPLPIHPERKA
jgi:hypothetical protein